MTTRTFLDVPGARLYYEVRGNGPVLLLMPGGPADASVFGPIVRYLVDAFMVVTYDPRGLSRSPLTGPLDDQKIVEVFADDVHRLLEATTSEPAYVFGSSGGASIALDLVARHPEQVSVLVSHEPPSPDLMDDPDQDRAEMLEVIAAYRAGGLRAAMDKFAAHSRITGPPPQQSGEITPEMREGQARMMKNMDFWFGHYFQGIADFRPDVNRLKSVSTRIVPGVGEQSRGEVAHEGGLGLARILGVEAVVFPGAHGGFDTHPEAFAQKLRTVLLEPVRATR